jgi:hypothetical protein
MDDIKKNKLFGRIIAGTNLPSLPFVLILPSLSYTHKKHVSIFLQLSTQ